MFQSSFLYDIRRRAIRTRVWFKALDSLDRSILSLSIKVLDGVVETSCLGIELAKIISKIEDISNGAFEKRLEDYGLRRAGEIAVYAVKFGCDTAIAWLDESFTNYVTFMSLNCPLGWRF